ncbi:hypothetical protein VOLCADRAFT_101150 [Volvox carteri f. nagariensis]|uniref:Uncharacterized protein n=1 Tax=Volvox carteri f. nagariensis TaxID=3068 RepID=D8ULW3_VOLCA|nr:uncharacterized protein VOLCADRAFT_101150 [Volvox carteri f. nagariensis]EFJ39285.1 hypothetical protein VOLCADRAFT_101150 [Volvox carteri f. nagariensis]|eukprot:XP_002959648.1 hypothetical protein VOLCADRAFT_101150 [Volvox carteri f. nagariensis]
MVIMVEFFDRGIQRSRARSPLNARLAVYGSGITLGSRKRLFQRKHGPSSGWFSLLVLVLVEILVMLLAQQLLLLLVVVMVVQLAMVVVVVTLFNRKATMPRDKRCRQRFRKSRCRE